MSLPKITVANLKRFATDQSFARGESYFRAGAVTGLTLRQQTLHAEVEGNQAKPYILLHENLVDDAVKKVSDFSIY